MMNEPIVEIVFSVVQPSDRQVVGVPPRHALGAEPVLHQERHVEADDGEPEVDLAQRSSIMRPVIFGNQK